MTHKGRRAWLGGLLALALAPTAIFVVPELATARDHDNDSTTTIKSFDPTTRTLVLSLPGGETVTGTVGRRTKIRCEDQSEHRHGGERVHAREAEPGDDHGGSGNEPGDDNGDVANCSVDDLVPGAVVEEVELEFGKDTVRFDEVELRE
jgi:hypothetical protein